MGGRVRVGRGVLVVVALAVGCTSSLSDTTRLVEYAARDWGCRIHGGVLEGAQLAVRVRATRDASGTVHVRFVHAVNPPTAISGSWRLDDGRLTFRPVVPAGVVDSSLGPTYGTDIRLDARRITLRGEVAHRPGSGNPVPVTVRRDGDRITLGTDALGSVVPGADRHSTIACAPSA